MLLHKFVCFFAAFPRGFFVVVLWRGVKQVVVTVGVAVGSIGIG